MDENELENPERFRLDLNAKLNVLRRLDNGETGQQIASDLGCTRSTISRIKKRREFLLSCSTTRNMNCKRVGAIRNEKLDAALLKFIAQASSNNIKISGPVIQDKALQFAELLGIDNFKVCMFRWEGQ